jgi:hypothetical protein
MNSQKFNDTIVIKNVNIIPMNIDTILKNHDVFISNKKIINIAVSGKNSFNPNYKIINGNNKYLLPGFSEMHFHNQNNLKNEFKILIANGITTVRNMAEYQGQDQIKNKELTQTILIAPQYFTTGPYLMRGHFKSLNDVKKIVLNHKERGYDFLKLADNLPKDIYLALLKETHQHDIKIVGHGQRKLPLEYSLRMKSIAHIEEFMNIFSKKDLTDNKRLVEYAKEIKNNGVYVSPTLGIYNMIMNYADDNKHSILENSKNLKYLPKHYADYWLSDSINYRKYSWFTAKESLKRLEKELNWQKKFTQVLHQEKVPLLSSSDTYGLFLPGFSLHKELELINSSGLSTFETLKTTTINPARYLNTISQEGTVSIGKNANLVLLNKNPLENIKNTKRISGVFLKGKWYSRKDLNNLLNDVERSYKKH